MALYTAKCPDCGNEQDYIRKIVDRDNTPNCSVCGTKTVKAVTTCMLPVMAISETMNVVSPIDGSVLRSRYDYQAHMKKHNVMPMSEVEGHKPTQPKTDMEGIREAASAAYDKLVGN